MQTALDLLSYPFMQRALAAGLSLAFAFGALGVFATLRRMAFVGEGVAHASLAGIAAAVLFGWAPLPLALAWGVAVGLLLFRLERTSRLPADTVMGILFTASMASGIVAMSFTRGYQPELLTYMFGNILSVRPWDLAIIIAFSAVIFAWVLSARRRLLLLTLSEDVARIAGVRTDRDLLLLYVALAAASVLGVKVLGIVLVSALLVIPAAAARLRARSFKAFLAGSIFLSVLSVFGGMLASAAFDLPSGACIVLAATGFFTFASLLPRHS